MARYKITDFPQSASAGRHAAAGDRPRSGGRIEMRPVEDRGSKARCRACPRPGPPVALLVSAPRAGSSLAAHARALCHLDLGNYVAANQGPDGDPLLASLDARAAGRAIAGPRSTRNGAQTLGRTRLLHSSP